MGYYTQYSLDYNTDEPTTAKIEEYKESNEEMKYCLIRGQAGKWYRWEEDMVAMSSVFPTVTFELSGVGEEYPDIWRATFLNGKITKKEKAVITYSEEK